ncbi:hypothetical protein Godav_010673 [Gossypium davidsonii]|uniref:Regulatory protein RecX n=2 Tax=Gossypium TaxID=3633 RepID=A0A7J8SIZ3_GOSDV|nr:hypothetical protein [Gossypium davidsonii]MBA0661060.1 hypothetical protein [Gossypium klotzschianum]
MSIFAGNLSFKISSTLQFRVFSFPWMNGNKAIFCLKEKEYSSSVPVRYIPKKSLETEEPETSSHSKGLSKNESRKSAASNVFGRKFTNNEGSVIDKKSQTRSGMFKKIALYDDVQQGDEIMEKPVEAVEEVPQGQNINRKNPLQACKRMSDAEKSAIELLAARAFTAVELRKKLLGKRFDPDIVETLITDLQNRGLINDSLYAEAFSRSRWSSSTWGPRRIKQALFKKGISESDAENALKLVFEGRDGDSNDDQESQLGFSKLSMDHLLIQASKQWLRGRDVPKETRKSRIVRWLQYRGFNWGVIGSVLKKLESQYPS